MNQSKPIKAPGFLSIFLVTVMVTVELLTLLVLRYLRIFPAAALVIIGCVMVMLTTVVIRMIFSKKQRGYRLRRFGAGVLTLCTTGLCLSGCVTTLLVGSTLGNMFGSVELGSLPVATPNNPTSESFAVYLSGSDTRGTKLTKSRSDVNIIAVVNPVEQQLLLINTPRDYYVSNPAGKGAKDKLAHCGLYGTDNSRQALAELYDVPIAYAAQINFKGFETLIDALGGVTITSDVAFTTTEGGYYIKQGENVLNGAKALAFARERSHLAGGDETRGQNQMKLIAALVKQASPSNLMANYRDILSSLEGMFVTDMPLSTITKLVTTQLTDLNDWEVFSDSVSGSGGTDYNYSSGGNAYVMYPNADSVKHASTLMQRVLDGMPITAEEVG